MIKDRIKSAVEKLLYIKSEFGWRKRISKVYKYLNVNKSQISDDLIKKHQQYWQQLKKDVNPKWFLTYSYISESPDIFYIPENIYFNNIEPKLNNRKLAQAYGDKNFYEVFYDCKDVFPETIIRNIDGFFYNSEYQLLNLDERTLTDHLRNYRKILIKPSIESGGGKKILLFTKENDKFITNEQQILSLEFLKKHFRKNYIIQNYIRQSQILAQFNPTSVNTIRVFTYRSVLTDEVIVLHAVLRIGGKGNYLDDQGFGGIACKITENNKLNYYATDINGRKHYESNGIKFSDVNEISQVGEMKNFAAQIARKNIHTRVIGFDFALDIDNKIKLIEINNLFTGINFFQMNSSSVFGKYTDEVVQFCKNN
jgi:hypothetical protein